MSRDNSIVTRVRISAMCQ